MSSASCAAPCEAGSRSRQSGPLDKEPKEILRFDLDNENETIRQYRERVRQCEALGEYAMAEHIREILKTEQEHQIDLATALGEDPPDLSKPRKH